MIIVTGSCKVKPDQVDEAVRVSLEHVHRSRTEPGCLLHSVHRDVEDPTRLVFLEHWADNDALSAHFAVPESLAFVTRLSELAAERRRHGHLRGDTTRPLRSREPGAMAWHRYQYPAISSVAHAGSRTSPCGANPVMYGLMSRTGRAVDRVESGDLDRETRHGPEPAHRAPDAVRSVLGPLGEDPDPRPVLPTPGMAGAGADLVGVHPVEDEQHLQVRERVQAEGRVRRGRPRGRARCGRWRHPSRRPPARSAHRAPIRRAASRSGPCPAFRAAAARGRPVRS